MTTWDGIRNSFIAGLILVAPLAITLYVLQILVGFALDFIDPLVAGAGLEAYTANVEVVARILAVALILLIVTSLGFLAQRQPGQRLFGSLGRAVSIIPVFRTIYSTVRQISSSFSSKDTAYDSLVLVEFPRQGIYQLGLVTNESPPAVREVAGTTVHNVFLPSSPNPASGRLALVPEDQLYDVDLSVGQGLGLLMTTGARESSRGTPQMPPAVDIDPEAAVESLEYDEPDEE